MPRKDGYQSVKEIRRWEKANKHKRMPIIALSANVMEDVMDKCTAAGFDSYVTKPVDFVDLSNAMKDLLDPKGGNEVVNGTQSTKEIKQDKKEVKEKQRLVDVRERK